MHLSEPGYFILHIDKNIRNAACLNFEFLNLTTLPAEEQLTAAEVPVATVRRSVVTPGPMGRPVLPPVLLQRRVLHLGLDLLPEVPRARAPLPGLVLVAVGVCRSRTRFRRKFSLFGWRCLRVSSV